MRRDNALGTLAALALSAILATPAVAQDPAAAQDRANGAREDSRTALLKRFDANGNGVLDGAERAKAHEAWRRADAQRKPASKGAVPKGAAPEKAKADKPRARENTPDRAALARRFDKTRRFDKNGDGRLDDAERDALRKALGTQGADPAQRDKRRRAVMGRFDRDRDGQLDAEEREVLRTKVRERRSNPPNAKGKRRTGGAVPEKSDR